LNDGVDTFTPSLFGVYTLAYQNASGTGYVSNLYGDYAEVRVGPATTTTSSNGYGYTAFLNLDAATMTTARLFRGSVDIEAAATCTTLYGMELDLVTGFDGGNSNFRPLYLRAQLSRNPRSDINGWLRVGGDNGFASATHALQVVGDISASGIINGIGSGLTALNASNLSSGVLPDARISGSYTGMTNLTGTGNVDFAKFLGNGGDTAAAPSFTWTTDTNTGIYSIAADQMGFTAGGVLRAAVTTGGLAVISGVLDHTAVSSRDKLRVWNSSSHTIGMQNSFTYGSLTNYAMTFQMDSTAGRGWWWGTTSNTQAQGSMSLTNTGILYVNSNITAGGNITQNSDARLKHSIRPWDTDFGGLIDSLKPSRYGWNDPDREQDDFGFIAQDIEKIFPQVITRQTNGMMGVDYGKLAVVAIAAVKQERARVASLEARIARIEAMLEAA
jgi:hypothetical protein